MTGYVLNGRFTAGDKLEISVFEPFFAHGHGLFETLRVHDEKPLFLSAHVERMAETARRLEIADPYDLAAIARQTRLLVAETGLANARLRYHLLVRADQSSDFLITAEAIPRAVEMGPAVAIGAAAPHLNGVTAMPGLKTMNYMTNRLAEAEGKKRGLDEVVFSLPDGTALEGTRTSLFLVRGGRLVTPPMSLPILPGVTRAAILRLARDLHLPVDEVPFPLETVASADEAFVTGSVSGIRPVKSYEGRALGASSGPMTRRLAAAYWALVNSHEPAI